MKLSVVGPNLPSTAETFHIHAEGCRDIATKRVYQNHRPGTPEGPWTMEAATKIEVCDGVYGLDEFETTSGAYLDDFKFFPCCGKLPTGTPVPLQEGDLMYGQPTE